MILVSAQFVANARAGRTPWWGWVLAPILALILWVAAATIPFVIALFTHLASQSDLKHAADPAFPLAFYGFTGVVFGGLALAWLLAAWLIQAKRPSALIGRWSWSQFALAAGLWLGLCLVGTAIDYVIWPGGFRLTVSAQTGAMALVAVPSLAVQTFCEELIFRGYVTSGVWLAVKRPLVAAVISGVIFAGLHIPNGVPQAAGALLFGIVTALIYMRTGNLAFTWGLHLINNLFGAIVVVSANDVLKGSPGVFSQSTPQLIWMDLAGSVVFFAIAYWVATRIRSGDAEAAR